MDTVFSIGIRLFVSPIVQLRFVIRIGCPHQARQPVYLTLELPNQQGERYDQPRFLCEARNGHTLRFCDSAARELPYCSVSV